MNKKIKKFQKKLCKFARKNGVEISSIKTYETSSFANLDISFKFRNEND